VKVYCGSYGFASRLQHMWERNYGVMLTPATWKYRNVIKWRYWALDNGAFAFWNKGQPFDEVNYEYTIREKVPRADSPPDFITLPDIIAGGEESLRFSMEWRAKLQDLDHPWYFVVQDGMSTEDVEPIIKDMAGLFVGGTVPWKMKTGESWVELAHHHGIPCHIGRAGTRRRVLWAKRIGCDSIDSTAFAREKHGFKKLEGLDEQMVLVEQ